MSSFDHRKADLRAQMDGWKTLMKPWEVDPIARAVDSYLAVRDDALTNLVAIVADDGAELKRPTFDSALEDASERVSNALGGILSGLTDPSEGARLFREQVMVQECGFFNGLDAPDPARTRDILVTLEADFTKMTTDLSAKWGSLKDNGKRILDAELDATRAINQLFESTIRSITPVSERIGYQLGVMLTQIAGIGDEVNQFIIQKAKEYEEDNPGSDINAKSAGDLVDISKFGAATFAAAKAVGVSAAALAKALPFLVRDPGMIVTDSLTSVLPSNAQAVVAVLGEMRKGLVDLLISPYVMRKAAIQDALPFQGTIIVSFSDTRTDVSNFMAKNGVDPARKLKDLSEDSFDHWVDSIRVAGNHDDAVDIKVAMQGALQKRFDRMLSALDRFVSDNSGIFLGTLNSDTRKLLLNPDEWDRQMSGLEGMDLDQRLRTWSDSVITIDSKTNDIWDALQGQLAGLPIDLQAPLMDRFRSIWNPLIASIRDAATGAQSDIEQSTRTAGSDQRHRDLDRSAVVAKLPA